MVSVQRAYWRGEAAGQSAPVTLTFPPTATDAEDVRFTLSRAATRRVTANPTARLRIADQTVVLNLTEG